MDWMTLLTPLTTAFAPWLPELGLTRWALHGAWGLVLGMTVLGLGARFHLRWLLALGVVAWSLWPGPMSPAYWLGLMFQSPSLMTVLLGVVWVGRSRPVSAFADHGSPATLWPWMVLAGAAVLLGWVLLLDMLAWWPVSVYAWGYGPAALATACGLTVLLWLTAGASRSGRHAALCLAAVLAVFVVTRLPSGNLWDALLDPWLWMGLQVAGLRAGWRSRSSGRRWSTTTRA